MDAEAIRQEYEPRIFKAMQRWTEALEAEGCECSSTDCIDGDEEYGWSFCFKVPSVPLPEHDIYHGDVTLYLTEEKVREGEGTGLSWFLSIVGVGGRILGTIAPYNYTSECWTDDPEELRERWEGIEGADITEACLAVSEES